MSAKILSNGDVMNLKRIGFLLTILVLFFVSCSPTIHYLGDSYQSTNSIDVYYDEKDVEKEYTTIGKMTHDKIFDYQLQTIKEAMIKKAKQKGGDGIIFLETNVTREGHHDGDRMSITAKVIRYKIT